MVTNTVHVQEMALKSCNHADTTIEINDSVYSTPICLSHSTRDSAFPFSWPVNRFLLTGKWDGQACVTRVLHVFNIKLIVWFITHGPDSSRGSRGLHNDVVTHLFQCLVLSDLGYEIVCMERGWGYANIRTVFLFSLITCPLSIWSDIDSSPCK